MSEAFNPDYLRQHLRPLAAAEADAAVLAYQAYYGLDLRSRHPRLQARLGSMAPWHLCGQSTGGAILLDYLLHGGERPELGETILLAPLVRPRAWGWSKLSYRLLSPFVDSIPRRFSENSSDPQFLDFLREHDPLQPRTLPTAWVGALTRWVPRIERAPRRALSPLVVQGESDETVDWRHGLKVLREKFDEPRILLLEEARHHLANESEGLRRRYFDFLSDALGA